MKTAENAHPDFCIEVQVLSTEQLKERVISLQQQLEESEEHKESNDALKEARVVCQELSAPYRDVKKAVKLKTKFILDLLKNRG